MEAIRAKIRDVPDFPKKGIVFKDITPAIGDRAVFKLIVDSVSYTHLTLPTILLV